MPYCRTMLSDACVANLRLRVIDSGWIARRHHLRRRCGDTNVHPDACFVSTDPMRCGPGALKAQNFEITTRSLKTMVCSGGTILQNAMTSASARSGDDCPRFRASSLLSISVFPDGVAR